jgi:hypothetical protein
MASPIVYDNNVITIALSRLLVIWIYYKTELSPFHGLVYSAYNFKHDSLDSTYGLILELEKKKKC